jgi:energy-coupling factor transporter ATP-binding protein EcfA2
MAPPLLAIQDLSFSYRERQTAALRAVTLEAGAGELILVAGASGCGKTTLIRCINGLIPRSYKGERQGTILLGGQDQAEMSLAQISGWIGTVLQDPERQILGTKVENEVVFGLENLGLERPDIRQRAAQVMDHLGLTALTGRDTFNLSGGEKQKVALAGVLAMQPQLLVLDEPLASLDPASSREALQLIRRLVDQGMCVLIVEHRVEDVLKIMPDRVVFMADGQIVYQGTSSKMISAIDYRDVKLPAPMIMQLAAADPSPPEQSLSRAEPARNALVQFESVGFAYPDGPPVLHDVSLSIGAGEVIAVLGANGAGKTTLIKHAIGLLKPAKGRVLIEGKDTRDLSVAQIAHTVGYVFQSPSHMLFAPSVREELAFGPTNLKLSEPEVEKEVLRTLETMNISELGDNPPLALSFGQQKRVSIAAILSMRSKILVMDEPTAGQDYRNYMGFMDSILALPAFQALVFITHDIDMAVVYATRVLIVDGGTIVADGPPIEVLANDSRLESYRLVPTSLLEVNRRLYPSTGRFMRAEALAHLPPAG